MSNQTSKILNPSDILKYAQIQIAAEALYERDAADDKIKLGEIIRTGLSSQVLLDGNAHASRFPNKDEAEAFASNWTLIEHITNTGTGFSGTLLEDRDGGELVLSFRSTEFIDDAIRDSKATNELEIANHGWAFGQISDMEAWVQSLRDQGKIPEGQQVTVVGYSLGGHLATAFNLLHQNDGLVDQVVTFNGAGVGVGKIGIGEGSFDETVSSLPLMIKTFNEYKKDNSLDDFFFTSRNAGILP